MKARAAGLDLLLALALAALPTLAALLGAPGPIRVHFNLGPGDAPYLTGFLPEYEIYDRVATQWSTRSAAVELPLSVQGGPIEVTYRLARHLPDPGEAEVSLDGHPVDHFPLRRGFEERHATLGALPVTPMRWGLRVEAGDVDPRGAHLDWLRFDAGSGARVRLRGGARWRAPFLVVIVFLILRVAGWRSLAAAGLASPLALVSAAGLRFDPWLVHRLLTWLPEWLAVLGLGGAAVGRWLVARGRATPTTVRAVVALSVGAFLMRGLALNHPDFYYPDLRSHVQLAQVVHNAGLDFLRSPATYILKHGVWSREIAGRRYAFPYTPAFHVPLALTHLGYDDLITAAKLADVVWSVVPVVALASLAATLGASPVGIALLLFVPIYGHHLSVVYLAAVFGHAVDISVLAWLARRLDAIESWTIWLGAAGLVALSELAYVGATTIVPVFIAALAAADLAATRRPRRAAMILGFGIAGSLFAFALYYRDFLGLVFDIVRLKATGGVVVASGDAAPAGFFETVLVSIRRFFPGPWGLLGVLGVGLLLRRGRGWAFLAAWAGSYVLLLLGRAKVPLFFQHPHEALFVAPLVCLGAGQVIGELLGRGGWQRALGLGLFAVLAGVGLAAQWAAFAGQLANAL
ncbi:MAG: hypothetical protein ACHQNV_01560 [Vicinamibacteria bacterium]